MSAFRRVGQWMFVLMLLAVGCADAGGDEVALALHVRGADVSGPFEVRGGWQVELYEAQVAFGPLWLCAASGSQASCEVSRVEFLESVVVDALNPEIQDVGVLTGNSGFVGTYWYDLGFVSLLTQEQPQTTPAAQRLGGSVKIFGAATKGNRRIPFDAVVEISQGIEDVEAGVPVVRRASDDIAYVIDDRTTALEATFDPRSWVRQIDFEPFTVEMGMRVGFFTPATPDTAQGVSAVSFAMQNDAVPTFRWIEK